MAYYSSFLHGCTYIIIITIIIIIMIILNLIPNNVLKFFNVQVAQ